MKYLLLILMLAGLSCKAQTFRLEQGVGAALSTNIYKVQEEIVRPGQFILQYQLRGFYKAFELRFDNRFWVDKAENITFQPNLAIFEASLRYQYESLEVFVEHQCVHPLHSDSKDLLRVYGGCNKIGINYNIK